MRSIPVLMYHHVSPLKSDIFTVTPDVFEKQMAYLVKAGVRALSIDELVAYIKGELDIKEKAVVITFDDGWLDSFIYAFPVLERYKLRAAMFIVTDWIEESSRMSDGMPSYDALKALVRKGEEQEPPLTWRHIEKMAHSGLIDFYSHTCCHEPCHDLCESELRNELEESKRVLEERLGKPCNYLCWPYGRYSDESVAISKQTGYKALFTIKYGLVKPGSDVFQIERLLISDDVPKFKKDILIYTDPVLTKLYGFHRKIRRAWRRAELTQEIISRRIKYMVLIVAYLSARKILLPILGPTLTIKILNKGTKIIKEILTLDEFIDQNRIVVLKPHLNMKVNETRRLIFNDVVKDFFEHFRTVRLTNSKLKRFRLPKNAVLLRLPLALLPIHPNNDAYFKVIGPKTRNMIRKAEKLGYEFIEFEWNNHINDIFDINTSKKMRSAGKMHGWYCHPVEPRYLGEEEGRYLKFYGVIKDNRLWAYTHLVLCGNFCYFRDFLGHADHLKNGIMNYLLSCVVRELSAYPEIQWLNYGAVDVSLNSGGSAYDFKRHSGFSIYATFFELEND